MNTWDEYFHCRPQFSNIFRLWKLRLCCEFVRFWCRKTHRHSLQWGLIYDRLSVLTYSVRVPGEVSSPGSLCEGFNYGWAHTISDSYFINSAFLFRYLSPVNGRHNAKNACAQKEHACSVACPCWAHLLCWQDAHGQPGSFHCYRTASIPRACDYIQCMES